MDPQLTYGKLESWGPQSRETKRSVKHMKIMQDRYYITGAVESSSVGPFHQPLVFLDPWTIDEVPGKPFYTDRKPFDGLSLGLMKVYNTSNIPANQC